MNFIKKLFENNVDEEVHKQFRRFSKGVFEERALIKIKKSKKGFKIYTSFEFINDLVELVASKVEKADVSGRVIKNRKKTEINESLSGEEIKRLLEENDSCLLNIKGDGVELKCKKSLPKPGSTLDGKFCKASLPLDFLNEFAFDIEEDFKDLVIKHRFVIDELVVPEEYKNDFAKAREMAKRKGKLVREIEVDGKKIEKEIELLA